MFHPLFIEVLNDQVSVFEQISRLTSLRRHVRKCDSVLGWDETESPRYENRRSSTAPPIYSTAIRANSTRFSLEAAALAIKVVGRNIDVRAVILRSNGDMGGSVTRSRQRWSQLNSKGAQDRDRWQE
jgi:hypothetical protein